MRRSLDLPTEYSSEKPENNFKKLPASLEEARKISNKSDFVKSHLPENILKAYKII